MKRLLLTVVTLFCLTGARGQEVTLQGTASGLLVMNPSGAPGETAKLRIRGFTSDSGNGGPLLNVDGLKVGNIQHLDLLMIEKVEVLKDAAATALYGIQGGNGVILITTRQGAGKLKVSYDFRLTGSSLGRKVELLDADDFIGYGAHLLGGDFVGADYDGTDTDWQDMLYTGGLAHQHNLSVQAGGDRGALFASVSYLDNDGIVVGSDDTHRRLSSQINGRYKVTDWMEVGVNSSFTTQKISFLQQTTYGLFPSILNADPLSKPYSPDGLVPAVPEYSSMIANPLFVKDVSGADADNLDINGIMYARFAPFKGFTATARFGYRQEQQNRYRSMDPFYHSDAMNNAFYYAAVAERYSSGYQADVVAEYEFTKGNHALKASGGAYYERVKQIFWNDTVRSKDSDVSYDDIPIDLETARTPEFSDLAFFAQAGYSFDDRYSLQASLRADKYKATAFRAVENPFRIFPTVSVGWTVSNESFFRENVGTETVSRLKLHGSWGKGGSTQDYEAFNNFHYIEGKFEVSDHLDVGLEAEMFKGRLGIGFDWFMKNTSDIPMASPNISEGLYSSVMNTGVELDAAWNGRAGDFSYRINGNISTLHNEVTSLAEGKGIQRLQYGDYGKVHTVKEAGMPLWYFYGYEVPADKNDILTMSEEDKTYIGKGIPSLYYGLMVDLAYKGFDMVISGYGTAGNSIASCAYSLTRIDQNRLEVFSDKAEWSDFNMNHFLQQSSAVVFDGSYFRIRKLQLGYTLPSGLTGKVFMQKARVFISLDDWFTFTSYPGGDPETATRGSQLADLWSDYVIGREPASTFGTDSMLGLDYGSYPMSRKLIVGITVSF